MTLLVASTRGGGPKTHGLFLERLHAAQLHVRRIVVASFPVEEEHQGGVPGIVDGVQTNIQFVLPVTEW